MKKLLIILIAALLVCGCSDNGQDANSDSSMDKETSKTAVDNKNEYKEIFQIGDTTDITTDSGMPYQITVNSFDITSGSVDGVSIITLPQRRVINLRLSM